MTSKGRNRTDKHAVESVLDNISSEIESLQEGSQTLDEGELFSDMLQDYENLDDDFRNELKTYRQIADDDTAKEIDKHAFVNGSFEIQISEDKMSAILNVTAPEGVGRLPDVQEILQSLRDMDVKIGINIDTIRDTIRIVEEEKKIIKGGRYRPGY